MIALQSQAIKLNTAMEELGSPEVDAAGSMAVTTSAAIGDTGAAGAGAPIQLHRRSSSMLHFQKLEWLIVQMTVSGDLYTREQNWTKRASIMS